MLFYVDGAHTKDSLASGVRWVEEQVCRRMRTYADVCDICGRMLTYATYASSWELTRMHTPAAAC